VRPDPREYRSPEANRTAAFALIVAIIVVIALVALFG